MLQADTVDVKALTEEIKKESEFVDAVFQEASKVIVGQKVLMERMMMALLCNGHVLLEGLPGLAKTLAIKTLAEILHVDFQRLQFNNLFP